MEVEISSNVKFFKFSTRGKEAKSWGNIGAFRSLKSQSMTKIFLARDHTGGIHNALMTVVLVPSCHHFKPRLM